MLRSIAFLPILAFVNIASYVELSAQHPDDSPRTESDPQAIQTLEAVIAHSGGIAAWQQIRSAKETFTLMSSKLGTLEMLLFLDDWSQSSTKYRRAVRGSGQQPEDHNGLDTVKIKVGARTVVTQEFDQARTIAARLPAAAAEVILRDQHYVVKTATTECASGFTCVDVLRRPFATSQATIEQRWKISNQTHQPDTLAIGSRESGGVASTAWQSIHYTAFSNNANMLVPSEIVLGTGQAAQTLKLVSAVFNSGFDISSFDQEATR